MHPYMRKDRNKLCMTYETFNYIACNRFFYQSDVSTLPRSTYQYVKKNNPCLLLQK